MKDPAFLFYSNDFYGGTRTMLPEERACYIDLMIYQHQNGYIPTDLRRVLLFCSGISEATLKAVLEAKFKLSDKGWYNERLQDEMQSREEFAKNRSMMGGIGQFWKKAKAFFSNQKEYQKYRKRFSEVNPDILYSLINSQEIKELDNPKAMLEAMLKHIENEDENEDENIQENIEGGMGETAEVLKAIDPFADVIGEWLSYKRERRESYKSAKSERLFEKQLREMSGGDPAAARKIVEQSIANNWAGIFPLKTEKQHGTGKNNSPATQNDDDELMRHIAAGMQRGREERERRALRDQQLR